MQTVSTIVGVHYFCQEAKLIGGSKAHQYGIFVGNLLNEVALQKFFHPLVAAEGYLPAHHCRGDGAVVRHVGSDGIGSADLVPKVQFYRRVSCVLQTLQYAAGQDKPCGVRYVLIPVVQN